MKNIITLCLLVLLSVPSLAQDDDYTEKVLIFFEAIGWDQEIDVALYDALEYKQAYYFRDIRDEEERAEKWKIKKNELFILGKPAYYSIFSEILAQTFEDNELDQLIEFYTSALGQKIVEKEELTIEETKKWKTFQKTVVGQKVI